MARVIRVSAGARPAAPAAAGDSSSQVPGALPPSPSHPSRQQWPHASEQAELLSKLESESLQGKGKGKKVTAWQNPYLASPFAPGEKEAPVIRFPGKLADRGLQSRELEAKLAVPAVLDKIPSVVEAAKPGIENATSGSAAQPVPDAKDRRPVLMSFDWGKKARRKALSAQIGTGALQRAAEVDKGSEVVQGKEDEKDDRRKRAEQILAQTFMEGADDAS